MAEFAASVAGEASVLRGRCLAYGEGITYWPIGEVVRGAAGDRPGGRRDAAPARSGRWKAREDGEIAAASTRCRAVRPPPRRRSSGRSAGSSNTCRRARRSSSDRGHPLGRADAPRPPRPPRRLDRAPRSCSSARRARATRRRPGWAGGKLNATTILLEPLSGEHRGLVDALRAAARSRDRRERIAAAAEGNPLFIEEVLAMLREDGLLVEAPDGTWRRQRRSTRSVSHLRSACCSRATGALPAPAGRRRACLRRRPGVRAGRRRRARIRCAPARCRAQPARARPEAARPAGALGPRAGHAFKFRHVLISDAAYARCRRPSEPRSTQRGRLALRTAATGSPKSRRSSDTTSSQAHTYLVVCRASGPEVDRLAERAAGHLVAAGLRVDERRDAATTAALLGGAVALRGEPTPETDQLRLHVAGALAATGELPAAVALAEEVRARAVASEAAPGEGGCSISSSTVPPSASRRR